MKTLFTWILISWLSADTFANAILIRMDDQQSNHLKAYGLVYWWLKADKEVHWLLNYQGGSFMMSYTPNLENECRVRGISYEVLSDAQMNDLITLVSSPDHNTDDIRLNKTAKIAVYSPKKISDASFEDTDAVLLVLTYAEIPFTLVYDEEILRGDLLQYDWLHLHHEDFTGQFGKDQRRMSQQDVLAQEKIAHKLGFGKVSQLKLEVAKAIKRFCAGGGYLFAMCSGAESLDVALAAEGLDIVPAQWDGDAADPQAQNHLDFEKTFAFTQFILEQSGSDDGGYRRMRSFSNINTGFGQSWGGWGEDEADTYFNLFTFSAKWDVIPAILTQNHEFQIREFIGQTTAFNKKTVKSNVLVMGNTKTTERYIYGEMGKGQFAFYGGHDPEGRHGFHRIPTDLNLFPHSPGYRLILNNVLFPSAHKKKRKT